MLMERKGDQMNAALPIQVNFTETCFFFHFFLGGKTKIQIMGLFSIRYIRLLKGFVI